jgi:hypothetical protein
MWLYLPPACLRDEDEECLEPHPSARGTEGSSLESSLPDPTLVLWSLSSGKPTPRPVSWPGWKKRPWIRLLFTTISQPMMAARGVEQWISSLRDFHANPTASPASGQESPTSDGSGTTSGGWLARWEPASCLWKMCQASLPLEGLIESSPTWPRAGGLRNGTVYQRQPSAPLTSVTGSSYSLPTPTSADCNSSGAAAHSTESGRHAGVTLTDAVVRRLPTPRACEARTPGHTNRHQSLTGMAKQGRLPTPMARDWKSGAASQETLARNSRPLNEVITSGDASPRLSPRFVEWMMGLPTNWTEIGPIRSISLETVLCPNRRRGRGARSQRDSESSDDE